MADLTKYSKGKRMVSEDLIKFLESIQKNGIPKIKVTNIQQLTNAEINSLKCGDIVAKKTGNQYHAYIVSYKEDEQGICLTYTDASIVETVSYDYTDGNWVYNSTDVTELGGGGGAEYKAGIGIEITDQNVINNTAPSKTLYKVSVKFKYTWTSGSTNVFKTSCVLTKNNPTLEEFLNSLGSGDILFNSDINGNPFIITYVDNSNLYVSRQNAMSEFTQVSNKLESQYISEFTIERYKEI